MRVYIAGAYRADTPAQVWANIEKARNVMFQLIRMGHQPFCLHTMTAQGESAAPDIQDETWLELGLGWLECCECVFVQPGWWMSEGTKAEMHRAIDLGIPTYYSLRELSRRQYGGDLQPSEATDNH